MRKGWTSSQVFLIVFKIPEGILSYLKEIDGLDIETASSCDEAFSKIKANQAINPFHILFTDLSFDNTTENSVLDGGEALINAIQQAEIPVKTGVSKLLIYLIPVKIIVLKLLMF